MSIRIDRTKCVGCQRCTADCPGGLIEMKEGTACIRCPEDCWGCASCVKVCPAGAIEYFLGADIGGRGSTMNVRREGDILHWNIQKYDGETVVIDVDRRNSNNY